MAPLTDDTYIEVSPGDLQKIVEDLPKKRRNVRRELQSLSEAPGAGKPIDLYRLCRGFETVFKTLVNSVDVGGEIKRIFFDRDGLKGQMKALPIENIFTLAHVKEVCRIADGYQGHLVSPELGLRMLVQEALSLAELPVRNTVQRVHQVLLKTATEASRKAAAKAGETPGAEIRKDPLQLPAFEKAAESATRVALDAWRDRALEIAMILVEMERSYITAAFFRDRLTQRYKEELERERLDGSFRPPANERRAAAAAAAANDASDSDTEDSGGNTPPRANSETLDRQSVSSYAVPQVPRRNIVEQLDDMTTGFLEKRVGDSNRLKNFRVGEGLKWQRRFFCLSDSSGLLYYCQNPQDFPGYKGLINLRDCKVEDVDLEGLPESTAARSKYELDGGAGQVSLLIKISHKDPSKACIKNHHSILLRAESAAEKYSWAARLRNAAEGNQTMQKRLTSFKTADILAKNSQTTPTAPAPPKPPKVPEHIIERPREATPEASENSVTSAMMFGVGGAGRFSPAEYDRYLQILGQDTLAYARNICETIATNVPKTIVTCQVSMAQKEILSTLFQHVSNLQNWEVEALLEEPAEAVQRRAVLQQVVDDLSDAIEVVRQASDRFHDGRSAGKPVSLPSSVLQLAGMDHLIPAGSSRADSAKLYGDYTPRSLQDNEFFGDGRPGADDVASGRSGTSRMSYADAVSPTSRNPPSPDTNYFSSRPVSSSRTQSYEESSPAPVERKTSMARPPVVNPIGVSSTQASFSLPRRQAPAPPTR